jgi:fatty acid desaturase
MVFAQTAEDARQAGPLKRFIIGFQHYLIPFVFPFQGFAPKFFGAQFLVSRPSTVHLAELSAVVGHHVLYVYGLIHFLGPERALGVFLVHHLSGGLYIATILATNHMGRPMVVSQGPSDFFRDQALPSRNVRTPWGLEFIWGALNHQIEHHLFPNMPRNQVRRALPLVRRFCEEQGIPYHEVSFWKCYREIFRNLAEISRIVRRAAT